MELNDFFFGILGQTKKNEIKLRKKVDANRTIGRRMQIIRRINYHLKICKKKKNEMMNNYYLVAR